MTCASRLLGHSPSPDYLSAHGEQALRGQFGIDSELTDTQETAAALSPPAGNPSALRDTRVIYCGDNLEQLAKLPAASVDLI